MQLLANNEKTYWVPSYVKEKRFHNWLENARDWVRCAAPLRAVLCRAKLCCAVLCCTML